MVEAGCLCRLPLYDCRRVFIIVSCASTLHVKGIQINTAVDAAAALTPVAGALAAQVFAFGLFVASIFSAVILPVAVSFYVCEAFGYEAGINKKWDEAPQFYWLYTGIIAVSAGMILIPNAPLIQISLWSPAHQRHHAPRRPPLHDADHHKKEVMGKYVNKPVTNVIGWATIVILIGLTATMVVSLFLE